MNNTIETINDCSDIPKCLEPWLDEDLELCVLPEDVDRMNAEQLHALGAYGFDLRGAVKTWLEGDAS